MTGGGEDNLSRQVGTAATDPHAYLKVGATAGWGLARYSAPPRTIASRAKRGQMLDSM